MQTVTHQAALEEFLADGIGFISRCAREHGDAVPLPFHAGRRMIWVVSDPASVEQILGNRSKRFRKGFSYRRAKAAVGEGLFTADGAVHDRHRELASPFFTKAEVTRYCALFNQHARGMVDGWEDGQAIDVAAEMSALTLSIVAHALFGADLSDRAARLGQVLAELLAMLHERMRPLDVDRPRAAPEESRRFAEVRAAFDDTIATMLRARRAAGDVGDDLLGRLLRARDPRTGQGFDDPEIRDQIITLLIAGHDTTAMSIAFALRLLSGHPGVLEAVTAEVDSVIADAHVDPADAAQLPRLGRAFQETLRLFPPVWFIAREATDDVELPALRLRKGDSAAISLFVLHRDPRWWERPDEFLPEERFGPGAPEPKPYTYLPWGSGKRICIGRSFAELESVVILATLLRRVRVEIDTSEEPKLLPHMLLRPDGGIPGIVRRRTDR